MKTNLFEDFAYKYFFDNYEEFNVNKELFWDDFVVRLNRELSGSQLKVKHVLTLPADYSKYVSETHNAINPIQLFCAMEDILITMILNDGVKDKLSFVIKAYGILILVKQFCLLVFHDTNNESVLFYRELFGNMFTAHNLTKGAGGELDGR